jgi:hypothetical protein
MPTLCLRRLRRISPFALLAAVTAQSPQQAAIAITVTPSLSPPSFTFTWPLEAGATNYSVYRRLPGATSWGATTLIPGGGTATTWTDSAVVPGVRYEYFFNRNGTATGRTFFTAGLEAPALEDRGAVVLLVDATHAANLGARLDRLVEDLAGDGWQVLRHDVPRTLTPPAIKATIVGDVAAHPGRVRSVFLLGHVPVPYSGNLNPDGHPDHQGAWPADLFYGELNGPWTDSAVNNGAASRPQNRNLPGDGKFDQTSLPSDVDLAVGRVDFFDLPAFAATELQLLEQYLDKDHGWRHLLWTAAPQMLIDDNFGWFAGEAFAASGWRNAYALLGPNNVVAADYFTTLDAPGPGYLWSYGCGGGSYQGAGGIGTTADFAQSQCRTVFTMLFGSYFGDWDSTDNFLRAPLAQGWTLANVWAGRPHWSFHPMGLGETIGACARYSQNDNTAGGFGTRFVHVSLLGDPTLRMHVVPPPTAAAVVDAWPQAVVSWTPPAGPVAGHHVYRAASAAGPFTRLTTSPVVGSNWTDPLPLRGPAVYMVRALRLETTPSGSYWNLSQGAFASADLPNGAAGHTAFGAGCYANLNPLQLRAAPAPLVTASQGVQLTYTIDQAPAFAPGQALGAVVWSFAQDLAGTPLDPYGMPGCAQHLGSLDVALLAFGAPPQLTVALTLPAGFPRGVHVFAQAVAFLPPLSLPNGQNARGALTSNGLDSFVNDR